jgi:hypothetical protein
MDRGRRCQTAYINRGSSWENGYIESFNARLRDEPLNGEIFYTLSGAMPQVVSANCATDRWWQTAKAIFMTRKVSGRPLQLHGNRDRVIRL